MDTPICGFGLADGSLCMNERERERCEDHEGILCGGCVRNEATHECLHGDGVRLCESCGHISPGQHGAAANPRDVAEAELDRAIELILEGLNTAEVLPSTQVQRRDAASAIRRGLTMHIAMKVLAGMARPEGDPS